MDIIKEYRKQKKSYGRFMLTMSLIFFAMPIVLYLTKQDSIFFLIYLLLMEIFIIIAIIVRTVGEYLNFNIKNNRIFIRNLFWGKLINISCDKVCIIDTEFQNKDINIIIITSSKFRNDKFKEVDKYILMRRGQLSGLYLSMKKFNPEIKYYYIIIKNGGYKKYFLLDSIFKNCLQAEYTNDAIERIKEFRNS